MSSKRFVLAPLYPPKFGGDKEGGKEAEAGEILHVKRGKPLKNIDFRIAQFKKGMWKTYSTLDGLAHGDVYAIHHDPDGAMWFGTEGGLSRYDGKGFLNFTEEDGLGGNSVRAIHRDANGLMWIGTEGGLSRYDGKGFVNFTEEDGLAGNEVWTIYRTPDEVMWIGTEGGLSRCGILGAKRWGNLSTSQKKTGWCVTVSVPSIVTLMVPCGLGHGTGRDHGPVASHATMGRNLSTSQKRMDW